MRYSVRARRRAALVQKRRKSARRGRARAELEVSTFLRDGGAASRAQDSSSSREKEAPADVCAVGGCEEAAGGGEAAVGGEAGGGEEDVGGEEAAENAAGGGETTFSGESGVETDSETVAEAGSAAGIATGSVAGVEMGSTMGVEMGSVEV